MPENSKSNGAIDDWAKLAGSLSIISMGNSHRQTSEAPSRRQLYITHLE